MATQCVFSDSKGWFVKILCLHMWEKDENHGSRKSFHSFLPFFLNGEVSLDPDEWQNSDWSSDCCSNSGEFSHISLKKKKEDLFNNTIFNVTLNKFQHNIWKLKYKITFVRIEFSLCFNMS